MCCVLSDPSVSSPGWGAALALTTRHFAQDFMANTVGHDSVINFAPVALWMTNSTG